MGSVHISVKFVVESHVLKTPVAHVLCLCVSWDKWSTQLA